MNSSRRFEDTIAVIPKINPGGAGTCAYIPYRALVPEKMDGLLVAGRSFSSDKVANDSLNLIPHCCAMGEAAGTAAALAVKNGVSPRQVDRKLLQQALLKGGAVLPGIDIT